MTIKTSRKQVPACAKMLDKLAPNWRYANRVLNFGCGLYPELTENYFTRFHNQVNHVANYDPNSEATNVVTGIDAITEDKDRFDVVLCANVLNVCEDIDDVLLDLARVDFDCAVIQIYEGNGTGVGGKTRDGYQRNQRVNDYIVKVQQYFHRFDITLHRSAKCITVVKGKRYYHLVDIDDEPLVPDVTVAPEPEVKKSLKLRSSALRLGFNYDA